MKSTKSLVSHLNYQVLGPFTLPVVRSDYLMQGELVVDILETPEPKYAFVIWQRHLKDAPRCDGGITHRWKAILPSPNSRVHPDALSAWLAASRYALDNGIDGVYDETTG